MAIPFVQSIDMNDFQILNFVVHSAASAPSNPSTLGGMMWYDTGDDDLKVYNDNQSAWNSLIQGPPASTSGNVPLWTGTNGNALTTGLSVNTEVASPGVDNALVTEQGIREAIDAAISGGVSYQGAYNAATNSPDLETPASGAVDKGYMYTVTVAGTFFTEPLDVGDVLIAESDDPSALADWTVVNRNIAETFLALGDTPSAYTAAGGFMVMVDSTPDALEFVDPSSYNLSNFNNDVISWGSDGQIPYMNSGGDDYLYNSNLGYFTGIFTAPNIRVNALAAASTRYATIDAQGDIGVTSSIPLVDLGSYADGSVIIGGAADWEPLTAGTAGYVLTMGASRPEWSSPGAPAAHALLGTSHSDTTTAAVSRGSLIYGNSTPLWDELVIGTAGQVLQSDGTDIAWSDDLYMANLAEISAGTGLGNNLFIGAYDVDGAAFFPFITLTSANTPTMDMNTAITVGGAAIVYSGGAFHDGFSDFVANEHIDHSSVTITVEGTANEITSSAAALDLTASRTWTIGLADNPTIPGTGHMYIPHGSNAQEIGTTPGQFRYDDQSGVFRGNVAGTWRTFATAGGAYHDGFSDFVANEHVDHSTVSITTAANSGLAGGGDLTATRNFTLDLNNLAVASIATGDFLAFWDITATAATKKITFANLVTAIETEIGAANATVVTGDVPTGASPVITHDLNLTEITDCVVQVWRQSDGKQVSVEVTATDADTCTLSFGSAAINPALGTYRFAVTGVQE